MFELRFVNWNKSKHRKQIIERKKIWSQINRKKKIKNICIHSNKHTVFNIIQISDGGGGKDLCMLWFLNNTILLFLFFQKIKKRDINYSK